MDAHDNSAEFLRNRVEEVAKQVSEKLQQSQAKGDLTAVPHFIGDIVNAVENAVGGVVNVAHDAVNAAVNATHAAVTAIAHAGIKAVHATEDIVEAVTAHTQQVIHVANIATRVTALVNDLAGGVLLPNAEGTTKGAHPATTQASAAELLQARRTAILQQRNAITNDVLAKRAEIKAKIAAIAARSSSSDPQA